MPETGRWKELSLEEVSGKIKVNVRKRSNGELSARIRLGVSLTNTVSVSIVSKEEEGGWQSAHQHIGFHEIRIVIAGWCALATLNDKGEIKLLRFAKGSCIKVKPGTIHNIYLPVGGIISTTKIGDGGISEDWTADAKLNGMCSYVTEADLLEIEFQK